MLGKVMRFVLNTKEHLAGQLDCLTNQETEPTQIMGPVKVKFQVVHRSPGGSSVDARLRLLMYSLAPSGDSLPPFPFEREGKRM